MRRPQVSEALNAPFAKSPKRTEQSGRQRLCMAPGCHAEGAHRAPVSPNRLNEYYWFCTEHAREYNARWDYFKGKSQSEIERETRADYTWHRPTWKMGAGSPKFVDPMGLFGAESSRQEDQRRAQERKAMAKEIEALAILDLKPPIAFDAIKARYKSLVKLLHPDANGGDRSAEERLKIVNQAYSTLKTVYAQLAG